MLLVYLIIIRVYCAGHIVSGFRLMNDPKQFEKKTYRVWKDVDSTLVVIIVGVAP
jgi:hypothetical protein